MGRVIGKTPKPAIKYSRRIYEDSSGKLKSRGTKIKGRTTTDRAIGNKVVAGRKRRGTRVSAGGKGGRKQ